jgi:hypothetical protein
MTNVSVSYQNQNATHDVSLSDGSTTYGLIYSSGPRSLQEIPLSPPAQQFENEQRNWIGGRGRNRYTDDPTGYFDDSFLWSTTDQKLMPSLQWRFAKGIRNNDTYLPADNAPFVWWKLYGNDPTNVISRYVSSGFVASANYSADKGYLIVRRRGTPPSNLLTFELCADGTNKPGTVLKTVTKTVADITDTISVFQVFDWTTTQALVSGTVYYIKVYGGANDTAANHWEVLGQSGLVSKYSADDVTWTGASMSMFYRIVDADTNRQWRFFTLEGLVYACSQNDDGTTGLLKNIGIRGIATSATATTLVCSALSMTTDQFANAYIRIYDGKGDGQFRKITSNTGTAFTVPTWDITPDTTSRFIVYYTDWLSATTGTHGLTAISEKPVSTGKVAYFPQGGVAAIRRMQVNGNSHDFAADGTNTANIMGTNIEGATSKVYVGHWDAAAIFVADAPAWGVNLTLGAAKYIGTSDYRITNMFGHNKTYYIFKEDGPYTYSNGIVEKIGNNYSDAPDRNMGKGVASKDQYLWYGWNHSIQRMLGSNVDDMLNFKSGYDGVPDNRAGVVSCIVSAVGWLFFVIDGGTTNYSSIIVWNGYGWHEIYRSWALGVRIRNAYWQPNIDARGRLFFDVGGDMAYIEFPKHAANPLKDSNAAPSANGINFQHEGVIVTSTYDAHDQNLYKILQTLRVFSEFGSVEIDYQINSFVGSNTWTVLGTASTQPVTDITLDLGSVFHVRFRLRLQSPASRTPTILTGWQLSGRMMPLPKFQYICTFSVASGNDTKTSETDHDPNTLYTQLVTWASQQTKLTMRSLSQSSDNKVVSITLPSKSVDWMSEEGEWGGRISFVMLET